MSAAATVVRVLVCLLACARAVAAQDADTYPRIPIVPKDEARTDPSLLAFRARLLETARRRDPVALRTFFEPRLADQFESIFLGVPESEDWHGLRRLLENGGAFTERRGAQPGRREFCAPYAFTEYPNIPDLPDGLRDAQSGELPEPWVVLGANVAVRAEPDLTSPIVARVSHQALDVDPTDRADESGAALTWEGVRLPDGRRGFVARQLLWFFNLDPHACFAKIDGEWKITVFARESPR